MTTQQYERNSLDVEGWLGSTALLLIVLYFFIPALSSFHVFSLTAGALALVSGFYSTIRELLERHMNWLALVLPVTYVLCGVYVLFHLASR